VCVCVFYVCLLFCFCFFVTSFIFELVCVCVFFLADKPAVFTVFSLSCYSREKEEQLTLTKNHGFIINLNHVHHFLLVASWRLVWRLALACAQVYWGVGGAMLIIGGDISFLFSFFVIFI
jgi:hypothetical protein